MRYQKSLLHLIEATLIILFMAGCSSSSEPISEISSESPPSVSETPAVTPTPVLIPSLTADPTLLLALKSNDPVKKAMAAQQIADTGAYPDGSIEALIECLNDTTRLIPSDKVPVIPPGQYSRDPNETSPSEQCGNALVKIGEPAVDPLIAALTRYGEGQHREKIAETLGLIGDSRALAPLIDLLENGSVGRVAIAVARIGGEQASEALLKAYDQVDVAMYSNFVYALGYSKDKRFLPILLDLLNNEDRGVKLSAIMALGYLENREAVPALLPLLQDEDLHVRWYSCEALGEIGDPEAILPLQELLVKRRGFGCRDAATAALEKIGK